jgi:hypothetical protein
VSRSSPQRSPFEPFPALLGRRLQDKGERSAIFSPILVVRKSCDFRTAGLRRQPARRLRRNRDPALATFPLADITGPTGVAAGLDRLCRPLKKEPDIPDSSVKTKCHGVRPNVRHLSRFPHSWSGTAYWGCSLGFDPPRNRRFPSVKVMFDPLARFSPAAADYVGPLKKGI